MIVFAIIALAIISGCGDGVMLSRQGIVDTGGGSVAVGFATLGGSTADALTLSPNRGQIDVTSREEGRWKLFGAFYAGGVVAEVASARVGGRAALFARDEDGTVALLGNQRPHRLEFPIHIYRRVRNGAPIDNLPPARAIAAADLDGDGHDELVASTSQGVVVARGLARFLDANPEKPPPADGWVLDGGGDPRALATADLDGDHKLDVVTLDGRDAAAWIFLQRSNLAGKRVALPAPGKTIVRAGCGSALVLLGDGRVMRLDARDARPALANVESLASDGESIVVRTRGGEVMRYDGCLQNGATLVAVDVMKGLAVDGGRLALLENDGRTLQLFDIR